MCMYWIWMWELDCKEGWALKNWCFQTVVLEKTLQSPLDSKEIKSVNPKGNQPWIFTGRTDAKALKFRWLMQRADSLEKTLLLGKIESRRRKRWQRMRRLDSITNSQRLLKLTSIESVMPSNHLILCHPLLLLPSIFTSIRGFFNELAPCIRWSNIGALASVLPMNIQGWFLLGLTDLISLLSKGLSWVFSSTTVQKHQFFSTQPSLQSSSHFCTWLLTCSLARQLNQTNEKARIFLIKIFFDCHL